MKFEQVISDIKNKIYHPIYFLQGEESYYIDLISDALGSQVLTDAEKTFNQIVLYGKDTEVATIINAAKRYPMMANHQVVIVKEAQNLKNIDDFIYYVEKPLKSTILVICYKYGSLDKRKKIYKALNEHAILFDSPKLYDNQIPDWIESYLKKKNVGIDADAAALLTEFLGNDLGKIVNELDKLMILLPKGTNRITSPIIEKNIGISKDYNNFELTKALGTKNKIKSYQIANYFAKNTKDNPLVVTLSTLYGYFSKILTVHYLPDKSRGPVASALGINPFFANDYLEAAKKYPPAKLVNIISYLRECDVKSKGMGNTSTGEGELLKELLFKILH